MPEAKNQQSQEVNQEMNGFKLFWTIIKTYYLQMILLNLLFIVSCIPIVTIGPALYALNTVTMSFARQKPIQPILEYREAFKTHFLKHMLIGLSVALLAGALVLSLNFYFNVASLTVLFYLAIILELSVATIIAAGTMYLFKLLNVFNKCNGFFILHLI